MLISVIVPSFNVIETIPRALDSVVSQVGASYEIVVADGGSTDGTAEYLSSQQGRLRWIPGPDAGQSDAMNKGMQIAQGDVWVFLNADDEFLPGTFGRVAEAFEANADANMVIGGLRVVRSDHTRDCYPKLSAMSLVGEAGDWPYNPVCYFARKELVQRIGPFPLSLHYAMDYWWLLRALRWARPEYIDHICGCFYNFDGNKTSNRLESALDKYKVRRRFLMSPAGLRFVPTLLKCQYWRWEHQRNQRKSCSSS
ncbi:glycosyltransferase family 2 protein [Roseiconus lacunae]|uniref:glycosyltransferase family 2 protein n=1 Tax=Roseiconus lacunae TaxID=2605694 RepID=UPI001E458D11|nr:glycosyltransferase family 2 protein [Roseiconus lacunae]MCD0458884.1 glycosyltransferase [Roseiconus lacunae]